MKAVHTIDHVVNTILRWIVMIMLRGTFKISSDLEYIYGRSSVRSQRFPCWS